MLYDDGDRIVLRKDEDSTNGNFYTEIIKSPLALISEADQRYQAHINASLFEEDRVLEPQLELRADPAAINYYLEPGEEAEVKREVAGEIITGGERIPARVRFTSELYNQEFGTVLYSNVYDPQLEALAEESVTVRMDEKPIKNRAI